MTVEADLFNAIKGLVSNRAYPDVAPVGTAKPYLVFTQAGGVSVTFLENAVPDKKNGRFQIGVWATTRAQAASIALQVESAIVTSTTFQGKPLDAPVSVYEADTQLYGSLQDFSIWSTR